MSAPGNDYEQFFVRQAESRRSPFEEARWMSRRGESADAIIRYLLEHGYDEQKTGRALDALRKERTACVRGIGANSIVLGLFLILNGIFGHPLVLRFLRLDGFSVRVTIGALGVGAVVTGLAMVFKPDRVTADISKSPFVPPIVPADADRIERAFTQWISPVHAYALLFLVVGAIFAIAAYIMYH